MGFSVESLEPAVIGTPSGPAQFDLPSKEFVGYDPKGTTTVTGSDISANRPAPQAEAAPATEPEATEETVTLSPKVSALARKEQAQRQAAQKLAKERAEFAAQLEKAKKFDELQAKIAAKDYSGIDELGVKYDEFVKHELNKEASNDPAEMRARKLEEEIAALKRQQEERILEEYEQNQALWKDDISEKIKDTTKFPKLAKLKAKGQDAEKLVLQLINDAFDEDGVRLTSDKAASFVEDALKERANFYKEFIDEPTATAEKVLGPPKASTKTITQTMTTTPKSAPTLKPFHLMSESEQIAEAIRRVQAAKLQR